MTFPQQSRAWREAGEYLAGAVQPDERVLAPDAFWWILGRVDRYVPSNLGGDVAYDWVVLNLDDLPQLPRAFVEAVAARLTPVYANDLFVAWAADSHAVRADPTLRDRLAEFWARVAQLGPEPAVPNQYVCDRALVDAPRIVRYTELSDLELRVEMNDLFRRTGYLYPTLRDQRYRTDIGVHVSALLDRCTGGTVLDLCSGGLRFDDIPRGTWVLRSDLSEVGVQQGRAADESRPLISYAVVDARWVAARDASVDGVLFMDSIEHVRDASLVLRECARVLVPGGWLLLSFANTDSVNQVMAEKLGYPRFVTNHQHIREFSLGEITELLDGAGLTLRETAGVSLYPYWGVPGLDDLVRPLTDDDPDVVDMMSELGRRVGADFAYTGVVTAQRPG